METSRRGFLRALLGGAAIVVAAPIIKPKFFFSFFGTGEVFVPRAAIIPGNVLTLADFVKRLPADRHFAKIAELMNEPNHILDDIPWMESPEMEYRSALHG
jgi:hypothetical protein